MEINEELNALKSENSFLKSMLENTNAEKIALDQLFVESLKSSLQVKKQVILLDEAIKKKDAEIASLKNEKAIIEKELQDLKNQVSSEAA